MTDFVGEKQKWWIGGLVMNVCFLKHYSQEVICMKWSSESSRIPPLKLLLLTFMFLIYYLFKSRCLANLRPLLDSGTMGTKGHTEVIVPHLTESYNSHVSEPIFLKSVSRLSHNFFVFISQPVWFSFPNPPVLESYSCVYSVFLKGAWLVL